MTLGKIIIQREIDILKSKVKIGWGLVKMDLPDKNKEEAIKDNILYETIIKELKKDLRKL